MSTVVTPSALVTALRDWGCAPEPYEPDRRAWHAHTTPGGWKPVGIGHHHTTGPRQLLTHSSPQVSTLRVLRDGRSDVPGPLCHLAPAMVPGTSRARVWLVGWGNVNCSGRGSSRTLDRVAVGTYNGTRPGPDDTDGNPYLWGLEYLHPGDDTPWPDALLDVGHRAACAICQVSGWSVTAWPGSNIEHREWTTRKIDRSWTGDLRAAIRRLAQRGPGMDAQDVWDCDTVKNLDKDGEPINPDNVEVQAKFALELALKHARGARAEAADARNRTMGLEVSVGQVEHQLGFIREDIARILEFLGSKPGGNG